MKNLLNCHSIGLHSFPISLDENGFYRRIFYASVNHNLWKDSEIAIHPHHVDIKITVLDGYLYNPIFKGSENGVPHLKFLWNSHILNGKGGFEYLGKQNLVGESVLKYKEGESVIMKACELHTIVVPKGKKCVWLIEESKPTCDYFPINYSLKDLTKWSPKGLYIECMEDEKIRLIGKYLDKI